jgi:hydrogenase expression/formation protein HypD
MRYFDEFYDRCMADRLVREIERRKRSVNIMEVCGTHTVTVERYGIREMLPKEMNLLSGPGCPVCVTPSSDIERAIKIAEAPDTILLTFSDMMKVPGMSGSLEEKRAEGADIRAIYSATDALKIATENREKRVVLFGIGFETTSPTVACTLQEAERAGVTNLYLLSCHKLIPPAMGALLAGGDVKIDGFICPGHVSTIIGSAPYQFIPERYSIPCVIAGFEPLDILCAILMLLIQMDKGIAEVEIQYRRSVKPSGNIKAQKILYSVFEQRPSRWRGIGVIPGSGLSLNSRFERFDGEQFAEEVEEKEERGCICGDILRGVTNPSACPNFGTTCTPETPYGPCMVSREGSCSVWYRYRR